jgi:hypothetical protein
MKRSIIFIFAAAFIVGPHFVTAADAQQQRQRPRVVVTRAVQLPPAPTGWIFNQWSGEVREAGLFCKYVVTKNKDYYLSASTLPETPLVLIPYVGTVYTQYQSHQTRIFQVLRVVGTGWQSGVVTAAKAQGVSLQFPFYSPSINCLPAQMLGIVDKPVWGGLVLAWRPMR